MASDSETAPEIREELFFGVNVTTYIIDSGSVVQVFGPQRVVVGASNQIVSAMAAKRGCVLVSRARALAEEGVGGGAFDMDFASCVGLPHEERPVYYGSAREAREAREAGASLSRYQAEMLAEFLRYIGDAS